MFNYTKSTALDTLDLIKRILFVFDLLIQIFYIGFLTFRIITQSGILVLNIVLVSISALYLIYYLINIREFYTKKHLKQKKVVKSCVRISKRIINIVVITIAVVALSTNKNLDNIDTLFTLLLVIGFIMAVFADIIVAIIDQRKKLFINALLQDGEDIKSNYELQISLIRSLLKIQAFKDPLGVDPKQLGKLKEIKHKYEQKKRRKLDFLHKKQNYESK